MNQQDIDTSGGYVYHHNPYSCICRACRQQLRELDGMSDIDAFRKGRKRSWIGMLLSKMPRRDGPARWRYMEDVARKCQARKDRLILMRRMWHERKQPRKQSAIRP